MSSRELVFSDGSSDKFWNIELDGSSHTVNYGRRGTSGQTKTKEFSDEEEAQKSFDKLVEQKLKKGYTDAGRLKPAAKKKTAAKKATATKKAAAKKTATKSAGAAKKSAGKKSAESPTAVRLVLGDAKSTKFWAISLDGASHTVDYGSSGNRWSNQNEGFRIRRRRPRIV